MIQQGQCGIWWNSGDPLGHFQLLPCPTLTVDGQVQPSCPEKNMAPRDQTPQEEFTTEVS